MDYTSTSSIPSQEGSSYVMLLLAVGVLKRSVPEMVVFNNLPPDAEKEMIAYGVKTMEGKVTPESYIDKLETVVKKIVNKSIKFDDYIKAQLLGRLNLSKSPSVINQTLGKETAKKIKKDGTVKSINEAEESIKEDPRFVSLPLDDKIILQKALNSYKVSIKDVTTQKLDWLIKRLRKDWNEFNPFTQKTLHRIMTTIDPSNWRQLKSELPKDFQLNSVMLDEAVTVDREQIKNIIKQKGSVSMLELLLALGVKPLNPPSQQQWGIYLELKKMLLNGELSRTKEGRSFKYSTGNGTPTTVTLKVPKVAKTAKVPASQKKKEALLKTIADAFNSFRPDGDRGNDISVERDSVSKDFRDLGNWIDDEEGHDYDDEDEDWREDNDNRIWAPGEGKRYMAKFEDWAKGHSWRKEVKLALDTSEKDWCQFHIILKGKVNEDLEYDK